MQQSVVRQFVPVALAQHSCARPVCIFLLGLLLTAPVQSQTEKPASRRQREPAAAMITPETEAAIEKGLKFLASRQNPSGSFGSNQYVDNIAVSSLTGLAMLSNGSTPGRGPYGEQLTRLVDFVLANTSPSGFIVVQRSTSHGPMYCHGFGTLFLAEVYGMTGRNDVREKLKKAIQLIVYTQNHEGGWRYQPMRVEQADLSVTICQIMALRAARNAGIFVPRSTVDKCIEYVRQSQNADGGFRYLMTPGPSAFPRSAAGVVALYSAGVYQGKEIEQGLAYLMEYIPAGRYRRKESHYFYGHYYAVQAMYQAGGDYWTKWYPAIRAELLQCQQPNGAWTDYNSICPEYGAAMACIILQMPNSYLPIFQR